MKSVEAEIVDGDVPKIRYVINTVVVKVEKRKHSTYLRGIGPTAEFIESDLGWFVHFDGSYEALHMGADQPAIKRGDKVKITFEKVS